MRLATGTVTAVSAPSATVTVGADSLVLPYVTQPGVADRVWVLMVGRTGLILGEVVT